MYQVGATAAVQNAAYFSASVTTASSNQTNHRQPGRRSSINISRSRPGTSSGDHIQHQSNWNWNQGAAFGTGGAGSGGGGDQHQHQQPQQHKPKVLTKERRSSVGRRPSFSLLRRTSSLNGTFLTPGGGGGGNRSGGLHIITDNSVPPALPDFALASAAKVSRDVARDEAAVHSPPHSAESFSKMLARTTTSSTANGFPAGQLAPTGGVTGQTESSIVHQHIHETAHKRISTLDYLRKAHEGRVYWFNTLLFEKPDLARMPYFDSRKLARRATNYLLLGLSLPTVIDLNSSTPLELLRSLNTLLSEFEAFQNLHSPENGSAASSLSRARLPNMFRRGTQGSKGRRTSNSANNSNDIGYPLEPSESNGGGGFSGGADGPVGGSGSAGAPGSGSNASMLTFAASDTDLLPGEEYTHLLTPSLPFDPDFFETFATLCDVLIDCYQRLLSLLPSPRECSGPVAELFTKADSRVRKIIIQGVVKEFEDSSRSGVKTEVANVGKVVLGGLM